jgi:N-methylhydantoinase A
MLSTRFDCARATTVMADLVSEGTSELRLQGYGSGMQVRRFIEARYVGQNYELEIPNRHTVFEPSTLNGIWSDFHGLHEERFGFSMPGEAIEVVNFRATIVVPLPKPSIARLTASRETPKSRSIRSVYFSDGWREAAVYDRSTLKAGQVVYGPALIEESASVTVVCPKQSMTVDPIGCLLLKSMDSARIDG